MYFCNIYNKSITVLRQYNSTFAVYFLSDNNVLYSVNAHVHTSVSFVTDKHLLVISAVMHHDNQDPLISVGSGPR